MICALVGERTDSDAGKSTRSPNHETSHSPFRAIAKALGKH